MARIGRYEIVEKIGEGGMGTVYKAVQPTLKKVVALKVLSDFCARDEELLARFKREARIMAALPDYAHVVQVYDLDVAEGKWFYTMEHIPFSLAEHIGEGEAATDRTPRVRRSTPRALPVEAAQGIIQQILEGLTVIHEAGVVHRDICPRNVLLARDGARLTAKVADFGIAGQQGSQLTRTGMSGMGKEIYAAPEQEESLSHADARSDLYSVGVLAYRLVTGRLPKGRFKDPMAISQDITDGLNDWILKLLEQEPEDRFESARAALDALRSSIKAGPSSEPTVQAALYSPKHRLRSTPKTVSIDHFESELGLNDGSKPKHYIQNDYVDNGDGTVTDRATGLMWQRSGSDENMNYYDAKTYIDDLNRSRLAGYSDWRLPTIPELMSLLEPTKKDGDLYIYPVFDNKQRWCWSADGRDSGSAWYVLFPDGAEVYWSSHGDGSCVRAVRCGQ